VVKKTQFHKSPKQNEKTMLTRILLAFLLLPALLPAQNCRCCKTRAEGQALFDAGNYEAAITKWETAAQLSDAAEQCKDLPTLLVKARQRIKSRDEAAALNRRLKEKRDASEARQRQADAAWSYIRLATNAEPFEQFLKDYPYSRQAADARRLRDQYKPKPAQPVKKNPPTTGKTATVASFLVKIPGGTFAMGDQFGEGGADELLVHNVTVSDFYLSKYEVSLEEFDAFCSATGREKPSDSGWGRGKRPAINVDWYDALEYCNWLSAQHGLKTVYAIDKTTKDPNNNNADDTKKWTVQPDWNANGYRLPTEAEWEYAARAVRTASGSAQGGGKVRFGNGRDIIDPSEINFDATAAYKKPYSVAGEYRRQTVPVDELSSNAFGLKNMTGNVWEWCWDWYAGDIYQNTDGARDPKGAASGAGRVLRGGSWYFNPDLCRASGRGRRGPNLQAHFTGFRVARHL
jgi:formylglycine-generating enzyme required for sulfatase activity